MNIDPQHPPKQKTIILRRKKDEIWWSVIISRRFEGDEGDAIILAQWFEVRAIPLYINWEITK